ncbi:MAG: hypothetical protein NZ927_08705 [Candidatus Calescibacterium sp.]|nr:hypothetical protein [Candidatus Calescibacterium sp.]MCX7733448.1 hypothetical protein [bacterium]MDW8087525.1 hypothetical protein [Candidatus Calescibacterium sp.]
MSPKIKREHKKLLDEFINLTRKFENSFGGGHQKLSKDPQSRAIAMIVISFVLSLGIAANVFFIKDMGETLRLAVVFMVTLASVLMLLSAILVFKFDEVKKIYAAISLVKIKFPEKKMFLDDLKKSVDDVIKVIPESTLITVSVMFVSSLFLAIFGEKINRLYKLAAMSSVVLAFLYGFLRTLKVFINFKRYSDRLEIESKPKVLPIEIPEDKIDHKVN